jgi:membrane-associated protease RseP (regulator of RpoE activity)
MTPVILADMSGLTNILGWFGSSREANPAAESARPMPEFRGMIGGTLELGYQASQGLHEALTIFFYLSIIVVLMNLFPYPATDGGELLMLMLERFPRWAQGSDARMFVRHLGLGSMTIIFVVMCVKDVVDSVALGFLW